MALDQAGEVLPAARERLLLRRRPAAQTVEEPRHRPPVRPPRVRVANPRAEELIRREHGRAAGARARRYSRPTEEPGSESLSYTCR